MEDQQKRAIPESSSPESTDGFKNTIDERLAASVVIRHIWRKNYTPDLISDAIDAGITQLDGLAASKRDSLLWWANRQHDASLAATQAAINDLCGSQNTLKNAVLDGGKRKVTRGEKLYATGTGSLASPGSPGFEGTLTESDIGAALEA